MLKSGKPAKKSSPLFRLDPVIRDHLLFWNKHQIAILLRNTHQFFLCKTMSMVLKLDIIMKFLETLAKNAPYQLLGIAIGLFKQEYHCNVLYEATSIARDVNPIFIKRQQIFHQTELRLKALHSHLSALIDQFLSLSIRDTL